MKFKMKKKYCDRYIGKLHLKIERTQFRVFLTISYEY